MLLPHHLPTPADWLESIRMRVFPRLSATLRVAVDSGFTRYARDRLDPPPHLIHHDLGFEHLLEHEGRLAGVIDFGDADLGDPAMDFVGAARRGRLARGRRRGPFLRSRPWTGIPRARRVLLLDRGPSTTSSTASTPGRSDTSGAAAPRSPSACARSASSPPPRSCRARMRPLRRGHVVDIQGKVAIVTGAASGIGRATARALAAEGASVVVADVDAAGGAATVGDITGADGSAVFVRTDVTSPESIANLFAEAEAAYGGVDIVYNNAGISSGEPHWPEVSLERIAEETHINTSGVMMGTREAIQAMRKRGGGVIINTASTAADGHLAFDPMYSATKKAVVSFTQSCAPLRRERQHPRQRRLAGHGEHRLPEEDRGRRTPRLLAPARDRAQQGLHPPARSDRRGRPRLHPRRLEGGRSPHRHQQLAAYHRRGRRPHGGTARRHPRHRPQRRPHWWA